MIFFNNKLKFFQQVNCKSNEQFLLGVDQHLGRIEVFNSLVVTAPKIDLERVRVNQAGAPANVSGNFAKKNLQLG